MYIVKAYSRTEQNKVTGQSVKFPNRKEAEELRAALVLQSPRYVYKVEEA